MIECINLKISLKWWVKPFLYLVAYPLDLIMDGVAEYSAILISEHGIRVKVRK